MGYEEEDLDDLLWGELRPESMTLPIKLWWEIYDEPRLMGKTTALTIVVSEHARIWRGQQLKVARKEVSFRHTLLSAERLTAQVDIRALVFRRALLEIAPRLYEADPRIGTVRRIIQDEPGLSLMKCPLFDPPGGVQKPLVYSSRFDGFREEYFGRWTRCGLCREPFAPQEEVTWGGGNLLWLCQKCTAPHSSSPIS